MVCVRDRGQERPAIVFNAVWWCTCLPHHPSRCLELRSAVTWPGFTCLFFLVSYRAGAGQDLKEGGFMPTPEGRCVSSALRTEFHGLCQCQTCEVQFFSWDISVIVDSGILQTADPRVAEEFGRLETEGQSLRLWRNREGGSWEKHSFNCVKTWVLCWAGFQLAKWVLSASHSCYVCCRY